MTAPRLLFSAASEICARCDGLMVVTKNAVGAPRYRCERCDGVAAPRPRHPDDAQIPQGLVSAARLLPPVALGQLRCQRCARGVDGDRRFCPGCAPSRRSEERINAVYRPKPCARCTAEFQPSGPRSVYCEACR